MLQVSDSQVKAETRLPCCHQYVRDGARADRHGVARAWRTSCGSDTEVMGLA
jgi:hypothetical protein